MYSLEVVARARAGVARGVRLKKRNTVSIRVKVKG